MARYTYIYKYCKIDCALSIINNMSFLLRNPSEFNDPFECCPKIEAPILKAKKETLLEEENINVLYKARSKLGFKGRRKDFPSFLVESGYIDYLYETVVDEKRRIADFGFDIAKTMSDDYLMACFSRNSRNPLMWAHYADQQKGCVLAFYSYDQTFGKQIYNVTYRVNRPTFDTSIVQESCRNLSQDEWAKALSPKILELLTTKSRDWRYEREVRYIVPNNVFDYQDENGRKFRRFSKQCLSGIAFGSKVTREDEDSVDEALKRQGLYSFVHQAITVLHPNIYEVQPFGNPEHNGPIVWPTYNDMIE